MSPFMGDKIFNCIFNPDCSLLLENSNINDYLYGYKSIEEDDIIKISTPINQISDPSIDNLFDTPSEPLSLPSTTTFIPMYLNSEAYR